MSCEKGASACETIPAGNNCTFMIVIFILLVIILGSCGIY